jgi:hypothetical protein
MDMKTVNVQTKPDNTATLLEVGRPWAGIMAAMPQLLPNIGIPTYRPTKITYDGKRYILREPLDCTVTWEEDDGEAYYCVDYDPFELYASGDTIEEAIELFNMKFDDRYQYYNELAKPDNIYGLQLDERLDNIRKNMNELVILTLKSLQW